MASAGRGSKDKNDRRKKRKRRGPEKIGNLCDAEKTFIHQC